MEYHFYINGPKQSKSHGIVIKLSSVDNKPLRDAMDGASSDWYLSYKTLDQTLGPSLGIFGEVLGSEPGPEHED